MARHTGQQDLTFGTLLSGRSRPELEPVVGFFVNTVVLRGDCSGRPTFRELVRRCDDTVLEAMAHQEAPFGTLKAGGAWLALDPQCPAGRLAYQLGDAAATVVVTTRPVPRTPPT